MQPPILPVPPPNGGEPMFPAVADKQVREESTVARPLVWAAVWGGLGALLSIVAALLLMYLLIMMFVVAVSDEETVGDIFIGLGHIWGSVPPEVLVMVLGICVAAALLSMGAVLLLRRSPKVRQWRPPLQGLVAAGAVYAVLSAVSSVLGSVAQVLIGR